MDCCSFVLSLWVSLSSRSRMSTYCLYVLMSQGMPAGNTDPRVVGMWQRVSGMHSFLSILLRAATWQQEASHCVATSVRVRRGGCWL